MSASSQSRQVAEQMKVKKVERRHALEERQKPKDDQQQHQQAKIGGVSAKAIGGDSIVESGKIEAKTATKKTPAKKASAKKKKSSKKS